MTRNQLTVGLPRYLSYYTFAPLWETFLQELGHTVVTSPPTNEEILNHGVRDTVTDACIPIKIFHGHVAALRDKVDVIVLPRLVNYDGLATFCPKFLGLPDMVRHSVSQLPDLIIPRLDVTRRGQDVKGFLYRMGRELSGSTRGLRSAYRSAVKALENHRDQLLQNGLTYLGFQPLENPQARLGVVGYPYILYDNLSSCGLIEKLLSLGIAVETPDTLHPEVIRQEQGTLRQNMFWYYSNQAVWAGLHFIRRPDIDGLVHVSAFGCGPDAMVDKVLELECKEHNRPFLSITIDELTGDAGVSTRIEAFVDMLIHRQRRQAQ